MAFLRQDIETTNARKETKKRVLAAVYQLSPQTESDRPSNQTVSIQPLRGWQLNCVFNFPYIVTAPTRRNKSNFCWMLTTEQDNGTQIWPWRWLMMFLQWCCICNLLQNLDQLLNECYTGCTVTMCEAILILSSNLGLYVHMVSSSHVLEEH